MGMPPGMVMDPRMIEQLKRQAQQQQQQSQQQQETNLAKARESANPLPSGRPGLQALRALSDCPIPNEAGQIKKLLDKLLTLQLDDIEEPLEIVGNGIAAVIMADAYCSQRKTSRPAVRFEDDEELSKLNTDVVDLQVRQNELQKELQITSQALQEKTKARWETAVNRFGLAPEKYTYELNEEEGIIYLVELKCNECSGKAKTRKSRQVLAEKLVAFEKQAKESSDDTGREGDPAPETPEGDAHPDGEARDQEQEISGVADSAGTDGSDGANGAGEAD